jgi:hypothetical protein
MAAKATVLILEQLPRPSTIGIPPCPAGGVIFSLSTGAMNRFSQLLNIACQIVDLLSKDQKAIMDLTDISFDGLEPIKQKLKSIDINLFECVDKLPTNQKLEIMESIQNLPSNSGISINSTDGSGKFYYKEYIITIQEDKNSPQYAKLRYAQVQNANGTVLLRGQSSFSSSTRVLIDEIKFRINNQLP